MAKAKKESKLVNLDRIIKGLDAPAKKLPKAKKGQLLNLDRILKGWD